MFMKNGENKTRLIEIISEVMRQNVQKCLNKLRCDTIYISQENETYCLKESHISLCEELSSNHEEADTKVILHCHHALMEDTSTKVILRSPSGDTDVMVLAAAFLDKHRTYIDYGNGKGRRGIWLKDLSSVTDDLKTTLIGFHAFTGNDYISSFFRKGKKMCWNIMKKDPSFINAFNRLGENWDIEQDDAILSTIEKYVCYLYSQKKEDSVNVVRYNLFDKKYDKEKKVIDMSLLPPCRSVLMLHIKRANYVAKLSKSALISWINPRDILDNGWNQDGSIYWVNEIFPQEVEEILVDPSFVAEDYDDLGEQDELSDSSDCEYD